MKLLTTPSSIRHEFLRLMRQYSQYSWATAWAGASSDCFMELVKHKQKIKKLVVGTHFYQTHPDFIEKFLDSDTVRFVSRTDELFHPKIYLFENDNSDWELLIGSANFTEAAFTTNTEVAALITATDESANTIYSDAKKIITDSWHDAAPLSAGELAKYRLVWETHRAKREALGGKYGKKAGTPIHKSAIVTMTWQDFYSRVLQNKYAYIDERVKVIDICHKIFSQDSRFNNLSDSDRKAIAGTLHKNQGNSLYGVDMNWFGSMQGLGAYRSQIIKKNPDIANAIEAIPLIGEVKKSHYQDFYRHFAKVNNAWLAPGTRLLAMKRPDIFVCLDSHNKENLRKDFGIVANSITFESYWDEIIGRISESAWWNSPVPKDGQQQKVWASRSAFLDAIYYAD